jgi:hypothetical protein
VPAALVERKIWLRALRAGGIPLARATGEHASTLEELIMICRPLSVALALFALPCSAPAHPQPTESPSSPLEGREYVDARSYFTEPEQLDLWYTLTFNLKADFDAICGDTFCEGEYTNYESLGFRCSVEQNAGTLGECVWIFAASNDEIARATGNVKVHTETWRCPMPIAPGTPARSFLAALSAPGQRPLYAPLPGTERALYDGLMDCL